MNDIMHIDLNSCFATIEQQSRPMLRGRPVAITNRITPNACIVAASYEAKAAGIKVGMRRKEAEAICKNIIFAISAKIDHIALFWRNSGSCDAMNGSLVH